MIHTCIRWLLFVLVAACGGSPSSTNTRVPEPAERQETPIEAPIEAPLSSRLGQSCDASTPCDDSTRCIYFCDDQVEADENCDEPSPHGFCVDSAQRQTLPLSEFALVFVAQGVHVPIAGYDEEMDDSRVLGIISQALAAGYRTGPTDAELRRRRFDVMGADGRVCTAVAESSWIVGLEPLETFEGADHEPRVGDPMPSDHMQYSQQNGAVYRTLRLEPEGDCTGALWVRDASLPTIAHAVASAREPSADELGAYRALSVYSAMQQLFEVFDPERSGDWMAGGEGRGFGPSAWDAVVNDRARVVVSTWAGAACFGFEGTLMTVFRDGEIESLSWERHGALQPSVALDVDRDGRLELIEHTGFAARIFSPTVKTDTEFRAAEATSGC